MQSLIFDCDGVLVDTERDGHRVAFNRAFAQAGFDFDWDVELYGELLRVAGGKERMRHYFDSQGWPESASSDRDSFLADLHKAKTAIFADLIASRQLPLRSGVLRLVDEAIAGNLRLGVCTTSNPRSIDAVLDLMGPDRKSRFEFVLAGDIVSRKKPDPEIYDMARARLDLPAGECIVIEDSRNGLLAAVGAGLPCFITTSTYTANEDFSEAVGIAAEAGDPPGPTIDLAQLSLLRLSGTTEAWLIQFAKQRSMTMKEIALPEIEQAIKSMTATALKNERYFSELDAAAGDADFGVSLASGFKVVESDWDELDRSSIGNFLLKISMIITRNVGGCSGPIWGTGFMRAGMLAKEKSSITLAELETMLTAAIEGIQQRGGAEAGDKTLLDALMPMRDTIKTHAENDSIDATEVLREATRVANEAIERTRGWVAKRGRQSFTGERSIGTPDPGIVAIATMMNDICESFGIDGSS